MTVQMIGKTFGRLTVTGDAPPFVQSSGRQRLKFLCLCSCGNEVEVLGENLRSGHSKSCGCLQDVHRRSRKRMKIGAKYARLTIVGEAGRRVYPSGQSKVLVKVKCDCGAEFEAHLASIKAGNTRSCGCLLNDIMQDRNYVHGYAPRDFPTREYKTWAGMIQRCENPKASRYSIYGGRGISVCREWRESFEMFLSDMGQRPSPDHSIDRIDVNGNYEPGNCRWATRSEQQLNKRSRKKTLK